MSKERRKPAAHYRVGPETEGGFNLAVFPDGGFVIYEDPGNENGIYTVSSSSLQSGDEVAATAHQKGFAGTYSPLKHEEDVKP